MSFLTAVVLGLIYGVAELLPISGEGHMALLQGYFHVAVEPMLTAALRAGVLLALWTVYRRDISAVLRGGLGLLGLGRDRGKTTGKNLDRRRMAVFLLVGTLPWLLTLMMRDVAAALWDNMALVSIMLLFSGAAIYFSDGAAQGHRNLRDASFGSALLVGIGQAFSLIPGLSRTGLALSAGLASGFTRSFAVQFVCLLSVPVVLGEFVFSLAEAVGAGVDMGLLPVYLGGMAAAAVSGNFSIRLMRLVAARSRFGGFAYYCWGAGLVALALSLVA